MKTLKILELEKDLKKLLSLCCVKTIQNHLHYGFVICLIRVFSSIDSSSDIALRALPVLSPRDKS